MRLISAHTTAVALLTGRVLGHPAPSSNLAQNIQRRSVNLESYKLGVGASYSNSLILTDEKPELRSFAAPTYTDTAISLVKKVAPEAEFRLVSSYLSGNGVGHVVFKQTLHGIDIDTADFNVNVKILSLSIQSHTNKSRLAKMERFFLSETHFMVEFFL